MSNRRTWRPGAGVLGGHVVQTGPGDLGPGDLPGPGRGATSWWCRGRGPPGSCSTGAVGVVDDIGTDQLVLDAASLGRMQEVQHLATGPDLDPLDRLGQVGPPPALEVDHLLADAEIRLAQPVDAARQAVQVVAVRRPGPSARSSVPRGSRATNVRRSRSPGGIGSSWAGAALILGSEVDIGPEGQLDLGRDRPGGRPYWNLPWRRSGGS